ncbi:MAG TPA: TolC family protein [Acidobacteriaceae bacterium]|nr:TolC family protein [Acidobacteriaceae bacterium]
MMRARHINILLRTIAGTMVITGTVLLGQEAASDLPVLTLSQAVQIAVENNRPVNIAKLNIASSKWEVAQTKTKRFPAITTYLFASGNLTNPEFTFPANLFDNKLPQKEKLSNGITGLASVEVAQPLSQLYQIHLAIREQELSTDLASEQYKQQRQSVVASVKQAYYSVLQTESSLEAQRALVKQYEETDRVATQYLAQKSVLKSDSLEAKAQLAQSRYQIVQLQDTLTTQKEQLNELLARDLDVPFRTEPVPPITAEEMDLKAARQSALQQRPEVREAEINTRRADYDRRLSKAKYIPDVGAAVHYLDPINTEFLPQNIVSAGMEMKWDPFDWGGRRDEVKQKDVSLQQSQYQLQETRAQVTLDVDNTFRKLQETRTMLEVAQAGRDAANEKLREVSDQFKHSAVLMRDLLQQEAAVANADHNYEQSLLAFWNAKAAFEKALGEE